MPRRLGAIVTCIGVLLLLAAVGFVIYNRWDWERAAAQAARTAQLLHEQININNTKQEDDIEYLPEPALAAAPETDDPADSTAPDDSDMDVSAAINGVMIDDETYIGIIGVPSLGLELPINYSWDYSKLKKTPCRYLGDVDNGLIIAAHNYPAHFGSISKLKDDDVVVFMDVTGNEYKYRVDDVRVLQATKIEELENSSYDLTLFTCTVGGEARIVVRCVKIT